MEYLERGWLLAFLLALSSPAFAGEGERYAVIVTGSGGEISYTRTFRDWGDRLQRFLIHESEIPEGNIVRFEDSSSTQALPVSVEQIDSM